MPLISGGGRLGGSVEIAATGASTFGAVGLLIGAAFSTTGAGGVGKGAAGFSTTLVLGASGVAGDGVAAGKGLVALGGVGAAVGSAAIGAAGCGGFAVGSGAGSSKAGKPSRRGSTLNGAAPSARAELAHSVPAERERKAIAVTRYRDFIMIMPDGQTV